MTEHIGAFIGAIVVIIITLIFLFLMDKYT